MDSCEARADVLVEKKAILALGGGIRLPEGYEVPFRVSRSTAGPGAGFSSIAVGFGGLRVKKSISYDSGEFELVVNSDGSLSLTRRGEPFLDRIELQPVVRHCPGQAFFNLDPRCDNRCLFCSSPYLDPKDVKNLDSDKIIRMLEESLADYSFNAVSFTSGVIGGTDKTIVRLADVIGKVRGAHPDLRIGVEPYVESEGQIQALKDAGADEIKLNLQCATDELFGIVCPDLDRGNIWRMLEASVRIFGKGNVVSNVIYGFGETDDQLMEVTERLCYIGAIPGLRALRINGYNRASLERALPGLVPVQPSRMVYVARRQKEIMSRYGLDSRTSGTMCLECGCCDIVPFKDV
ncbi:MAG: radical SAM protein [Candidatus Methanomethylophilaceae archaeon]|nr:radical SAM protein [Candidatus Methanomethylophilaceae archaeon]